MHPGLYTTPELPPTPRSVPITQRKQFRAPHIKPIEKQPIKQLLRQYKNIPREKSRHTRKPRKYLHPTRPPNIPTSYIPVPKSYKPTRPSTRHHMLLRRNIFRHKYSNRTALDI